jgi:hypothetical protein
VPVVEVAAVLGGAAAQRVMRPREMVLAALGPVLAEADEEEGDKLPEERLTPRIKAKGAQEPGSSRPI